MGRLFRSFTFKIWFPFTIALIVIISISAWYYPKKQQEFLLKNKSDQILELSKTVSKSYELAHSEADFDKVLVRVQEITEFALKDHDIDYIEIHEGKNPPIRRSKNTMMADDKVDKREYFFKDSPFEYVDPEGHKVRGFVRIAVLKKGIEDEISAMNRPIYFILFGIAIFFVIAFYFLARWLSSPILQLTQSTRALSNQDYFVELPSISSNDEIGVLFDSIEQLRTNLIEQKEKNDKFVFGLEELVEQRTQDLKSTQELLISAQKNANLGTFVYTIGTNEWRASRVFEELLEIPIKYPKDLKGLLALIGEDTGTSIIEQFEKIRQVKGRYLNRDIKLKRRTDGKELSMNLIMELKYKKDELFEVVGSVQDITQRAEFQEEIERLSLVATKTTNLVVITDENEKIQWVNDAAVKMTEYSRDEIIGNSPNMFQYEKTDSKTVEVIRKKLDNHEVISEIEIQNRSKSGNEYWLSINIVPIKNAEGKITGFISIQSDITQQKEQLALIAEKEKLYRNILDTSSEMIHSLNEKAQIKYANKAWLENMGYKKLDDVLDKPIIEFFTPDTLAEFSNVMPQLMKGQVVPDLSCEFISKSGEILNIKGRSKPIMLNNEFVGSEAYLFNVTSVLKAEHELEKMSQFQHLLMQISTEYINAPVSEINKLIDKSLADIAVYSSADRAYVFLYNYDDEICSITHEWVGPGIPAQIDELKAMPFSTLPYSLGKHTKGDFVEFTDVSKVKDKRIHSVLSGEGIQSLISIPMMDGDVAIGFIGFDIMKTKREFNEDEKSLMRLYSEMIVNVFNRRNFIEELQSTKEELSNINISLEKKVHENTRKNIDLSRSILEQEKLVTIGEISAGIAHDLNTPLGTIRVGTDNVGFILNKLFRDDLNTFSKEDLVSIMDYVQRNKIEIYIGGLQIREEKVKMSDYLSSTFSNMPSEELDKFSELLVKCRIDPSQDELIKKILEKENNVRYLQVLNQVQIAVGQLETIKTSSDKAVRVVQDVRAFIKGETTVERKMINLRENISTVLGVFNYEISLYVDLKLDIDEKIELMGYDIKLFQLWSNIVKNALEAMSDQEDKYLGITAEKKNNKLIVTFENNGPKIPDDIVKNIFNKFYTTKAKKSGSGLGLSIVKNVLKEHKADIKVESSDSLTKFIITFDL